MQAPKADFTTVNAATISPGTSVEFKGCIIIRVRATTPEGYPFFMEATTFALLQLHPEEVVTLRAYTPKTFTAAERWRILLKGRP